MNLNVLKDVIIPDIKKEFIKTVKAICEYIVYGSSKNNTTCTGGSVGRTTVIGPAVIYRP